LRLHRIASEEKNEIETNRPQEREELLALYSAKGFSRPLLDKVVDVLMADQDRLLRVMLQEEMGYRLEEQPHPIVQGLWAGGGVFTAFLMLVFPLCHIPTAFTVATCIILVAVFGAWFARLEKNSSVSAFVWNLMIGSSAVLFAKTFMEIYAT
jgi:VIT1/CCC1 family predicted Fe2+/Mn2+ transporter